MGETKKTMSTISPQKDWFLYLLMDEKLCRLNINEFCRRTSPKPLFEVVHDFYPGGCTWKRPSDVPIRMKHIFVDSKLYLVGGEIERFPEDGDWKNCPNLPNLDVYTFDPIDPEGRPPSISLCNDVIPRLIDPSWIDISPIVVTLEDNIYILATIRDHQKPKEKKERTPVFKVYDTCKKIWKNLPLPPCYDDKSYAKLNVYNHFAWGHKLSIHVEACSSSLAYIDAGYIFDAHEEKWEDWPKEADGIRGYALRAAVEFQGFLIGVDCKVIAYQLDSNGIPKTYRVLHELQGIFCPFLLTSYCFMGKCDGGRMWLVYRGKDLMEFWHTRVAVFRVSISEDLAGNPVLSAEVEATEFYFFRGHFDSPFSSAFSMCHHSNKHDIEEKNLCGQITPHDHP